MTKPLSILLFFFSFPLITFLFAATVNQSLAPGVAWHGEDFIAPRHYVCYQARTAINVDGKLNDAAWKDVPWSEKFIDIEGSKKANPPYATRVKMLWDSEYFYIGAQLEEPHVWATLKKHDSVIFQDNDFEVFIDPDADNHRYMEYEINAFGTDWDLYLPKAYKDGGSADNSWEISGLKKAVFVDGTINDPTDRDQGWSVELAIPWKALGQRGAVKTPPTSGQQWRVNFSRVEWKTNIVDGKYVKVKGRPEDNWVWSPQYVINMHRPETWGIVQFSTKKPGQDSYRPDPTLRLRHELHKVLYLQRAYRAKHGKYANSITDLGLDGKNLQMTIIGKRLSVEGRLRDSDGTTTMIRLHDDARVEVIKGTPKRG